MPRKLMAFCLILTVLGIGVLVYALNISDKPAGIDNSHPSGDASNNGTTNSTSSKPTEPEPVKEVKRVKVASMGDILIHTPVLSGGYDSKTKTYNFDDIFTQYKKYSDIRKYDFSVINLEVTLAGDRLKYDGYPGFNTPDSIVDAALKGGFNMMTTANNHTYDTGFLGMTRTMEVLKEKGMLFNGTRPSANDKQYIIPDVGGVKVGMITYTYETTPTADGRKSLNGITLSKEAGPLVNSFDYNKLDAFYSELTDNLKKMKADGSQINVIYLHWGNEYQTKPNSWQKTISKKINEIGFDVIIGGHPHVVQPVEVLKSETTGKQTVCLYSMGNAISNQRRELMNLKTGHTEDGLIFETEFVLYSDGDVRLSNIDVIPTWTNMFVPKDKGRKRYEILPLDKNLDWKKEFGISDAVKKRCDESYARTMALVKEGLDSFKSSYSENQKELG